MKSALPAFGLLLMSCNGFAQVVFTITSPASLPGGMTGAAYSQTLQASNGVLPYTWSITSGALPDGLVLASSGTIAGVPTTVGTATFTAMVVDANSNNTSQAFTLVITAGPLSITSPTTLPGGSIGVAYSQALTAAGGTSPYVWVVVSGALPAGLSLSNAGLITGVPTATGTATFGVDVIDSRLIYANQSFTLSIAGSAVTVTTPSTLTGGVTGGAYLQALAATGGVPPYTWSVISGALPPGLTLSSAGVISGTPTAAAAYVFTVQVQDSASQTISQAFSLTVTVPSALQRVGILSQLAAGNGWDTRIWLVNRSATTVQVSLVFHGNDGTPLSLPFIVTMPSATQQLVGSTITAMIVPNTTLVVATSGTNALVTGWVDVQATGSVSGFAVFRNGGASEAAVPLQSQIGTSFSLPFDNANGYSTGVALVNLGALPANFTVNVWDQYGNLTSQPVTLTTNDPSGNGHDSFMLPDRVPITAGIAGIVQFVGNPGSPFTLAGMLTGLGLKTDPNGLFTSLPTIVP